jgi:flavin-dependent dehydrogenase
MSTPEVRACMPQDWYPTKSSCQCLPFVNVSGSRKPFADRFLFIGDAGVTRLYKDGIGAAYRTAKTAARVAVFKGISENIFRRYYRPVCRRISWDNRMGRIAFGFTGVVQNIRFLRQALLRMTTMEQLKPGKDRRLSGALWDMFSGSASYRDIMGRLFHPGFVVRFLYFLFIRTRGKSNNIQPEVIRS